MKNVCQTQLQVQMPCLCQARLSMNWAKPVMGSVPSDLSWPCVCVCVCVCVRERDFMSCHMLMRNLTMAKSTFTGCYKAIWGIKGTGRLLDCIRYLCVSVLNTGKGKWRTFSVEPRVVLHLLYYEQAASISQFIKSALSISLIPQKEKFL